MIPPFEIDVIIGTPQIPKTSQCISSHAQHCQIFIVTEVYTNNQTRAELNCVSYFMRVSEADPEFL